jgi:hypothetical protein
LQLPFDEVEESFLFSFLRKTSQSIPTCAELFVWYFISRQKYSLAFGIADQLQTKLGIQLPSLEGFLANYSTVVPAVDREKAREILRSLPEDEADDAQLFSLSGLSSFRSGDRKTLPKKEEPELNYVSSMEITPALPFPSFSKT